MGKHFVIWSVERLILIKRGFVFVLVIRNGQKKNNALSIKLLAMLRKYYLFHSAMDLPA